MNRQSSELSRKFKNYNEKLRRLKILYKKKFEEKLEKSTIMKDNLYFL